MVRGLYTAALGMITQMDKMDVVANNIANVDTTAYKRDQVVSQSFTEELMKRLHDPVMKQYKDYSLGRLTQGVYVNDIYTDFATGPLRQTAGPLDIALDGQGFFRVSVGNEILYTRDGSFTLSPDGRLMTTDGGYVQGQNGDIVLQNGIITIDEAGRIFVNDEYADTLSITDIVDKHMLRKEKDNYYRGIDGTEEAAFAGFVIQGFLENSNVNSIKELVEMITLSRTYDANSRMITVHDTIMGRAVNDIGGR
jgi:flagellar basal-body rod protein FlgG